MSTDTFFCFRNQFRTFLWYPFRTGWGGSLRSDVWHSPGYCENRYLEYASNRTRVSFKVFDISYIICSVLYSTCSLLLYSRLSSHRYPHGHRIECRCDLLEEGGVNNRATSTRISRLTSTSSLVGGCVHAFLREYHAELSRQRCVETFLFKSDKTVKHEADICRCSSQKSRPSWNEVRTEINKM